MFKKGQTSKMELGKGIAQENNGQTKRNLTWNLITLICSQS